MNKLKSTRAISYILAGSMMVGIAVLSGLFVNAFVLSYMENTTTRAGKAILIQGMGSADGRLTVHVQNVGESAVSFDPTGCVYINSKLEACTIDKPHLSPSETATITVLTAAEPKGLRVKVVTIEGASTEVIG
jgi:archaellum component FlaF (FlaF/FlaG flagellin family)